MEMSHLRISFVSDVSAKMNWKKYKMDTNGDAQMMLFHSLGDLLRSNSNFVSDVSPQIP